MKQRTVTKEELLRINALCKKKDIDILDLRIEFVDHIAKSIEELWVYHPKMTFKDALNTVYKRYGVHGFMNVVQEHAKTMQRTYRLMLWEEIKPWFTPPRIFLTLLIGAGIYFLLVNYPPVSALFVVMISLIMIGVLISTAYKGYLARRRLKGERTLLYRGAVNQIFWFIYLLNVPFIQHLGKKEFYDMFARFPVIGSVLVVIIPLLAVGNHKILKVADLKAAELMEKAKMYLVTSN